MKRGVAVATGQIVGVSEGGSRVYPKSGSAVSRLGGVDPSDDQI
jgi:hypothetical protein